MMRVKITTLLSKLMKQRHKWEQLFNIIITIIAISFLRSQIGKILQRRLLTWLNLEQAKYTIINSPKNLWLRNSHHLEYSIKNLDIWYFYIILPNIACNYTDWKFIRSILLSSLLYVVYQITFQWSKLRWHSYIICFYCVFSCSVSTVTLYLK